MSKLLTKLRPSPALVVATVALVVALGGTSFALPGANNIDRNDLRAKVVKTKNIRNGAVTGKKIKRRAVSSSRIANSAVGTAKIRNANVRALDLADNSVETDKIPNAAVTNEKLAANSVSAGKLGNTVVRVGNSPVAPCPAGQGCDTDGTQNGGPGPVKTAVATATCGQGERLLTGGARWIAGNEGNDENLYINESYPTFNGQGWRAEGIVDFGAQGQARLQAIAVCLRAG